MEGTSTLIEPRTLRGFADALPVEARRRRALLRVIEDGFDACGFDPIHTPALEYAEILRGKGGEESDKQMYEFEDQGGRRVAMRFDLTVPLARFVAEHRGRLQFPFRAYQIGPVWRGERPQKGRYREFVQCDVDIVGSESLIADAEILNTLVFTLERLDIGEFTVRVNDRRLLNAVLGEHGLTDCATEVLRVLDKLDKVGIEAVAAELVELGVPASDAASIVRFLSGDEDVPAAARPVMDRLDRVLELAEAAGVRHRVRLDPSIARGLDYYTGIVYETRLETAPEIGSIASGGRYDDLASLFTQERLPGVGASIGIGRILGVLAEQEMALPQRPLVVITNHGGELLPMAMRIAAELRALSAIRVDVLTEDAKHSSQMKAADRVGAALVITAREGGTVGVKDMRTGAWSDSAPDQVRTAVADALHLRHVECPV